MVSAARAAVLMFDDDGCDGAKKKVQWDGPPGRHWRDRAEATRVSSAKPGQGHKATAIHPVQARPSHCPVVWVRCCNCEELVVEFITTRPPR